MKRATREEWAARVAQLKESGLSVARFAADIGVNAKTLAWWRAELASPSAPAAAKPHAPRPIAIAPLKFVEMTTRSDGAPVEVVLPSGIAIRVRSGFDLATLARVLDVVESRHR
jgi:transposase-like protein